MNDIDKNDDPDTYIYTHSQSDSDTHSYSDSHSDSDSSWCLWMDQNFKKNMFLAVYASSAPDSELDSDSACK